MPEEHDHGRPDGHRREREGSGEEERVPSRPGSRLAGFVERLRAAGLDPTAEGLAEALWLARWVTPEGDRFAADTGPPEPAPVRPGEDRRRPGPSSGSAAHRADGPSSAASAEQPGAPSRSSTVSLYAPGRHDGAPHPAFSVHAPAVSTLPGLLGLQRAMRPLFGYRPRLPSVPGALDETATADLSARSGAVRPAFAVAKRRESEVQLLMDASATASVWRLTFDSLRQTCEQLGAFRDVQARYLHRAADGTPLIGTGPDADAARLRPADEYRDTTGRRLTLVVSDCVGALWQDGAAQRLLHRWTGRSPLAVVQPLPPRMWARTALPAGPGTLVRDTGAGGRVFFEPDGYEPRPEEDALAVPVLLPTPAALGSWARLLGGNGRRSVRGAAAWVRPRHHAMPEPRKPALVPAESGRPGARGGAEGGWAPGPYDVEEPLREDPRALLDSFRSSASAGALDLVVHLSAVPLVLPVIQLVQTAMLPGTGPMELAEVLLSGLLLRLPDIEDSPGPRYEYKPGVRDLLLQSLGRDEAALLNKHLSDYIEKRFGKVQHNFPALAAERLSGRAAAGGASGPWRDPGQPSSNLRDDLFAQIPARVLSWYSPAKPVPAGLEGAERLLRRWWEQGDPQLLHQARTYAQEAVVEAGGEPEPAAGEESGTGSGPQEGIPRLARARLVLGQVLHALTETGEVRREQARVRELLHAAARQLTAPDPETRFELAAVRHDLWQAEEDSAHLRAAAGTLRSLAQEAEAAGRPLSREDEARRRLWLGRVLCAEAQADGPAGEDQRSAAAEAVTELRAAGELLEAMAESAHAGGTAGAGRAGSQLCAALLDLSRALRLSGAPSAQRLANLERARAAAGENDRLRMRCARAKARVHRDEGELEAAYAAYEEAVWLSARDSPQRRKLLTEWGTMLLDDPEQVPRAAELLREAHALAPSSGPLAARLPLLLGRALVARYHSRGFLPDLYEGCHYLEQSARKAESAEPRAEAWLRLGDARLGFPPDHVTDEMIEYALNRSMTAALQARGDAPASASVARVLHTRGVLGERSGRTAAALADYRASADEWRRLAAHLLDGAVPWDEVRGTWERIAALEAG